MDLATVVAPHKVWQRKFKVLLALADTCLQWSDQDRFERSNTPKYLTVDLHARGEWLTKYLKDIALRLFKIRRASHFEAFKRSCHLLAQSQI